MDRPSPGLASVAWYGGGPAHYAVPSGRAAVPFVDFFWANGPMVNQVGQEKHQLG